MIRTPLLILFACVQAFACSKESPTRSFRTEADNTAPGDQGTELSPACRTRIKQLTGLLEASSQMRVVYPADNVSRLSAPDIARPVDRWGPAVVVAHGRLFMNHEPMNDLDKLRVRLEQEEQMIALRRERAPAGPGSTPPLYLVLEPATPVTRMRDILAAVPAGFDTRLVVWGADDRDRYAPPAGAPDQVRTFWRAMQKSDRSTSERAIAISKALETAIGACQPLIRMFGDMAAMSVEERGPYIAETSIKGIRECGCEVVDTELFEAATMAAFDAHERRQLWLPLLFDDKATSRITLPTRATVADYVAAYQSLPEARRAGPIRLTL